MPLDLLFGSTHTVDKEASFDRELSFWFSSYTKYQSAIEIDEPGIFKGNFENGFPVGVAIDLSVISLSVDITDAHISVNPTISLFGYQLNVKSDIGFDTKNNYSTPEVNFSFGYGETDKWSQDWGIKVSTDVWNGVVGGYGRYTTMTKIDNYSHSVNSIETGFQTLNGIHAIAIVGVFMVPELVLPLISSPAFLK
ncbi:hypothetical protein [Streptococcus acidominimus]|uniref:hypothetical protein n=1 Tax=Streptococcus acidominimus TaxID=1326 RepID=UPI0010718514|nr:hypothetical protein [Streptococcus acidominimus]MBF0839899.1 hypothetical protein [Streptococcus acidominimus]MBF0845950.1 hypothetical protein [Streptococcus danieliae]